MRRTAMLFLWLLLASTGVVSDQAITELAALHVYSGPLDAVAFSPDGGLLASGGRDHAIRLWQTETGENIQTLTGHGDWITSLAFSPDGTLLASAARDHELHIRNAASGALLHSFSPHTDYITALAFTPDSSVIASGSRDGTIWLMHIASSTEIATLENYGGPVWDLAFSPDGSTLASAGEDGLIWLWGIWDDNGVWLYSLQGHEGPAVSLAFSPNGRWLLSGGLDGLLRLWDLQNREGEAIVMRGHIAPIMGVGFTGDAAVALSASLDGTVRLWDVAGAVRRGRELAAISTSGAPLTGLALNPEGTAAASAGTDGVLRLWDVGPQAVQAVIASSRPVVMTTRSNTTAPAPAAGQSSSTEPESQPFNPPPEAAGPVLSIPSAGIYTSIKTFPLDGVSWAIDPWETLVGHLQGTAWLNGTGNIVLGGHSQYPNGRAGIFAALYRVGIGDEIYLWENGSERRYIVAEIRSVNFRDLSVIHPTAHNRLTLITCDIPSYIAETGQYWERLVVIADAAG